MKQTKTENLTRQRPDYRHPCPYRQPSSKMIFSIWPRIQLHLHLRKPQHLLIATKQSLLKAKVDRLTRT